MTITLEIQNFKLIGDPQQAAKRAAYMKNQFIFLGVPATERNRQSKTLLQASREWQPTDLKAAIVAPYQRPAREYQYVTIQLANQNIKCCTWVDLVWLTKFVTIKSWWDSVDAWRKVFSDYLKIHPEQKRAVFQLFQQQPNFWMRRIAITLQLPEKNTVDPTLLTQAIEFDLTTNEFFIQKAIVWALRQYSKTNPDWVKNFIKSHQLSQLAQREGQKYLKQSQSQQ